MAGSPEVQPRSKAAWAALIVLLIEAFGGLLLLVPTTLGMLDATSDPIGARLSIFLSAVIAWVWVCLTLLGALRLRASWVRGSAVAIHVLLFAAGTGVLQLGLGSAPLGWSLILLAFVGFAGAIVARPRVQPQVEQELGDA